MDTGYGALYVGSSYSSLHENRFVSGGSVLLLQADGSLAIYDDTGAQKWTTIAVLMMLANANHAGIPFLGNHPKVSQIDKNAGIMFAPFWLVVAVLNSLAFYYSLK